MVFDTRERGRGGWVKRAIFIPIAIVAGIFIFGSIVMLLWNGILPDLFGIKIITFWQALGLLVLCKILFGGFRGGGGHQRFHGHSSWHGGRWMHLTPEERERMRAEWRGRCEPQVKEE